MQPKWLAKSATAIVLVALMATETVNPVPAYAGVPGVFAPNTRKFSTTCN